MLFNLRFGCQLCAGFYQIYSTIFIVFYLCTFASPNFLILVNLAILSNQTNRFMYTLAQTSFWSCYLWCATVLYLSINWMEKKLAWPFMFWCVVNVIWETILIACKIAFFEDVKTIGVIFWKLVNITLASSSFAMLYLLFKSEYNNSEISTNMAPEHELDETEPVVNENELSIIKHDQK